MLCKNCNTEIENGKKFCPECGAKIEEPQQEQPVIPTITQNENFRQQNNPYSYNPNNTTPPVGNPPMPTGNGTEGQNKKFTDKFKFKKCPRCGMIMKMNIKYCPNCNTKCQKPFYLRWYFIAIIIIVIISIISSISGKINDKKDTKTENVNIEEDYETTYTTEDKFSIKYNLPNYYVQDSQNENSVTYSCDDYAILTVIGVNNSNVSADNLTNEKVKAFTNEKLSDNCDTCEFISIDNSTVDNMRCFTCKYKCNNNDSEFYSTLAWLFDIDNNCADCLMLITIDEDNDYVADFNKMVKDIKKGTSPITETTTVEQTTKAQTTVPPATKAETTTQATVTASFKETMDSYEAFMDKYVTFMKNYTSGSGDIASMLTDYANIMSQYSDWVNKIDNMDTSKLSAVDYAYYLEVTARVTKKLASVL